jgi:hypothetical protein
LIIPSNIGSSNAPILRTVPFECSTSGKNIFYEPQNPVYVRVKELVIDSVSISIYNSLFDLFPFITQSESFVTLHFRPVEI